MFAGATPGGRKRSGIRGRRRNGFAGQTWFFGRVRAGNHRTGDSYGYRIVKGAPTALGLSESTLYPILRRLKASGHVTEYAQEHNERTRKYYSITPQGRGWLAAFVAQKSEIEDVLRYIEGGVNRD